MYLDKTKKGLFLSKNPKLDFFFKEKKFNSNIKDGKSI